MTIPSPTVMHFRGGRAAISKDSIRDATRSSTISARPTEGDQGVLRRRLPLSAVRRHRLGLSLLGEGAEAGARARRTTSTICRQIYPEVINMALKAKPADMDDHHACLPRQFPLDLDLVGRLRAGGRDAAWPSATTTAISWNTTPTAPAASSRCASCPRATSSVVLGLVTSKIGRAGEQGRHQAAHRRSRQVRAARPALPVAAVRLCLDRGRQRADRGPAVGQAEGDRRHLEGCVGRTASSPGRAMRRCSLT